MDAQPRDNKVRPDSETARLFKEAAASRAPMRVDTGETVYRIAADTEMPATLSAPTSEDIAASIAGIQQATGSWRELVDAEELKACIRERRRTKNRPTVAL